MAVSPRLSSLVLALWLIVGPALGAEALKAELFPLTLFPRRDAPALFDLRLTPPRSGLLEGRVAIVLTQGGETVLQWSTQEIAFAGGAQTLRLLTPPLPPTRDGGNLEAKLEFVTKAGAIPLGTAIFAAESRWNERRAVIAVCTPRERSSPGSNEAAAWRHLRFERVIPSSTRTNTEKAATTPLWLDPDDFPTDPLACCAFDLVLLEERHLEKLRPRSLNALVRWVEGGGNVAIVPQATSLDDRRALLARLLTDGQGGQPIEVPLRAGQPASLLAYAGLGRAAVLPSPAPEEENSPWGLTAAEFLWGGSAQPLLKRSFNASDFGRTSREADEMGTLIATLWPQQVRLLSPWAILGILTGLLALVGPMDWLVLGRLRARRFTWLLFPAAVAAATGAMVLLANRSMGGATHRGAATITDLGPDGRALRQQRFELTVVPRARTVSDPIAGGITSTFTGAHRGVGAEEGAATFDGQFPARYELRRALRQWEPSLVRTLSFGGADDSGLPWARWEKLDLLEAAKARTLRNKLTLPGWEIAAIQRGTALSTGAISILPLRSLRDTHSQPPSGRLPPPMAPQGGGLTDDLAMSDANDARQWLVIATRREGRDVRIYRRLFFQ
jgi:hypothetical protein